MKIVKSETPEFDNYIVITRTPIARPWWYPASLWNDRMKETELDLVIEADDVTRQVVRQIRDKNGNPLFTNGSEEIALTNEAKLLLLVPPIREAFLKSGFHHKVIQVYEENLKIINKNPTVNMAVEISQELGAEPQ